MGRKYQQTKQARDEFKSDILDFLKRNHKSPISKADLCGIFNMSERSVRAELERIANYYPIRATAGREGYQLIWWDENSSIEELNQARLECAKQVSEIEHRIESLNARLKPLIANIEVINDKINNKLEEE